MLAYQVCEWTTSLSGVTPAVIARSVDRIRSALFASARRESFSLWAIAPSRGSPMQWTWTSMSRRSSCTRKSTWTPAPPYTSGGNSRVRIAARITSKYPGNRIGNTSEVDAAPRDDMPLTRGGPRVPTMPKVLAIVLAGGEGKRLLPLTADRAKPAVPFAGIYRLIDLALSNVVNSGYLKVVVLTQYKSHSLDAHVTKTWRMSTLLGNYVTTVPAQQRVDKNWYLGSADAIYQSLNLMHDERPDIVVVV